MLDRIKDYPIHLITIVNDGGYISSLDSEFLETAWVRRGQSEVSYFLLNNDIDPSKCAKCWTYNGVQIMSTKSNLIIARVFLVHILNYKPCHMPLKYMSPVKKSDHIGQCGHFQSPLFVMALALSIDDV